MTITLMVITDGRRDCLDRTLASFEAHVDQSLITRRIVIDDAAGDPEFVAWVDTLGFDQHLRPEPRRRGFAGAVAAGWAALRDTDWVFHLEDDFVFCCDVELEAMIDVLVANPHLAQMALKRQPWNSLEWEAGDYVQLTPEGYTDRCDSLGRHWVEQRIFFTTNPSIYARSLTVNGWPNTTESEGKFSLALFEDPQVACAIWGRRDDSPRVTHIGQRAGIGY